jgi:hypothetical protein
MGSIGNAVGLADDDAKVVVLDEVEEDGAVVFAVGVGNVH